MANDSPKDAARQKSHWEGAFSIVAKENEETYYLLAEKFREVAQKI